MSGLGGSYIGVGVVGRLSCVSDGGVEVRLVRWLGREFQYLPFWGLNAGKIGRYIQARSFSGAGTAVAGLTAGFNLLEKIIYVSHYLECACFSSACLIDHVCYLCLHIVLLIDFICSYMFFVYVLAI